MIRLSRLISHVRQLRQHPRATSLNYFTNLRKHVEMTHQATTTTIERERKEKKKKMSLVWLEAALPLGIIGGMLCIMGNSQYYIHKAYHGRPKHIGHDEWDVAMERCDKKVVEKATAPSS